MFRSAVSVIVFASAGLGLLAAPQARAADQSQVLDQALAMVQADTGGDFNPADYSLAQVSRGSRWDGGYVGGFLAYTRGGLYDSLGPIDGIESFEGWMAGLDAGIDFTVAGGLVAGVVADAAWASVPAVDALGGDLGRIGWGASLRGRVGIDADTLLPYLTAGVAAAGAEFASPDGLETVGGTHIGWTVGIGLEAAVDEHFSIDLNYRYSDYGTVEYAYTSPAPATVERGLTAHQISLGINYAF